MMNLLPWELNNPSGPSVPYGGPISDTGSLHFYNDNFYAPTEGHDYMVFPCRGCVCVCGCACVCVCMCVCK